MISKKKILVTVTVLELATLLFAGQHARMLSGQLQLSQTLVPVESVFPGARAPQLIQQLPAATPAATARKQAPAKPDPNAVVVTKVFAHPPQRLM